MVRVNRCSTYYGQCSEICGVFHGFMRIVVETVSVLDYLKYVYNTSFLIDDE
jgi:cytochrome c oxidase subunit 2